MYRIVLFFLCLSTGAMAQSDTVVKDLDIRILSPKLEKNLSYANQSKLERKVIDIFTQHNIVNKKESTFAVSPILSIIEFGKLEGLSNEITVQLEFGLEVKNQFSGQYFLVFSQKLSGSGKTKKAAVNRAISNIRPQKKSYADFIKDTQEKISDYYTNECDNIIADARRAITNNEYQKAIALLYVLPENSACKQSNQTFLDQTYHQYQTQNCQSLIQKAEIAMLKKDYKDAINALGQVDADSPCKDEAKAILQTVTAKVDEQTAKKMDFLNKVYSDNVDIEKARQKSMKSISNTYIEGIKKE